MNMEEREQLREKQNRILDLCIANDFDMEDLIEFLPYHILDVLITNLEDVDFRLKSTIVGFGSKPT